MNLSTYSAAREVERPVEADTRDFILVGVLLVRAASKASSAEHFGAAVGKHAAGEVLAVLLQALETLASAR